MAVVALNSRGLPERARASSAAGAAERGVPGLSASGEAMRIVHHRVELLSGETPVEPYLRVPVRQLLAARWGIMEPAIETRPMEGWPEDEGQREVFVVCRATGAHATADDVVRHGVHIETSEWLVGDHRERRLNVGRDVFHLVKNVRSREGFLTLASGRGDDDWRDLDAALMKRLVGGSIDFPISPKRDAAPSPAGEPRLAGTQAAAVGVARGPEIDGEADPDAGPSAEKEGGQFALPFG